MYSTFTVPSITRLSSSDIVFNYSDCVVCHGASVIIGHANASQIGVHIATLMTVMVTLCCSWCPCIWGEYAVYFFLSCTETVTPSYTMRSCCTDPDRVHKQRSSAPGKQWSPIEISTDYTPCCTSPAVFIYTTVSVPWQCWFTSHYSTYAFRAITMWSYIITKWIHV